ncbi:hypothetical protein A3D11_01385 [Candidatus Peribacteria bacterium RIFCSPHIGHO2_02_FULL_49_16]|nr:MAG: hypothetical protein A3D11_01385 [Candidatus Peribacteria bacterium RIFCSPHIGHO2_02_FULL_49_16]
MPILSADHRPRVLLFIDVRGWAFDQIAQAIQSHLGDQFRFTILSRDTNPIIREDQYDIVHVFFETDDYYKKFLSGRAKVIRSVYSHYWESTYGMGPMDLYHRYLSDANAIVVPSVKLLHRLSDLPPPVHLFAEGVDTGFFRQLRNRMGPLVVGWAGRASPIKRLEMLQDACQDLCELRIAGGSLNTGEMVEFFNDIDVIACTSIHEGCPRPLIEGMACGNFPVSFDVGIASEVITHTVNGLLLQHETVNAVRGTLTWCRDHLDIVRGAHRLNIERIGSLRDWKATTAHLGDVYRSVLNVAPLGDIAC